MSEYTVQQSGGCWHVFKDGEPVNGIPGYATESAAQAVVAAYEEERKRSEAQPHHQKCSWCDKKPVRAVAPVGEDGDVAGIRPELWASACPAHIDRLTEVYAGIKGDKVMEIITENDPEAKAEFEAMSKLVADHISGDGVARHAAVDFGVKCNVCGRANLVLVKLDSNWKLGCAYAIGNGLCLNYVRVSDIDADVLIATRSVLKAAEIMEKQKP